MDKKQLGAVVLILVVIAIGLTVFFVNRGTPEGQATPVPKQTTGVDADTAATAGSSTRAGTATVIRFTADGFSPATLTVKVGDTVTVRNDSDQTLDFDSDPHPTHTDNPFLNLGGIAPGESKTVAITTAGTFGYHDPLNPSLKGTIVAQ